MIRTIPRLMAYTLAAAVLLFVANTVSASSWQEAESGHTSHYNDTYQTNTHIGAVGANGTTIYSTDGGETWTEPVTISSESYQSVAFDGDTLYAVATAGIIVQSDDGGESWTPFPFGTSSDLHDIDFAQGTGLIVGSDGTMFHLNPDTNSWTSVSVDASIDLHGAHVSDDGERLYATGTNGTLVYSTDGGASWITKTVVNNETFNDVYFVNDQLGYLVGENGAFFFTLDGGVNWDELGVFGLDRQDLNQIEGTDQMLFVAGEEVILRTDYVEETIYWIAESFAETGTNFYGVSARDTSDKLITQAYVAGQTGNESTIVSFDEVRPEAPTNVRIDADVPVEFGTDVTVYWDASSSEDVAYYRVMVDYTSPSVKVDDAFSYIMTDLEPGDHNVAVWAVDHALNESRTTDMTFTVSEAIPREATPGNLVKIECEGETDVNHPCRTVYYYGSDGKRHAFPNEKVFFTWFDGFDDVVEVSSEFMADLTLGSNVTYHPGTKMVKFLSVPTVYAVEKGGVLRAIASEAVAEAVYGEDWQNRIDDISDSFFSNYTFGTDIETTGDYDVEGALNSVDSLNEQFQN